MLFLYRARLRSLRMPPILAALPLLLLAQPALSEELTLSGALSRVATGDPAIAYTAARLRAANAGIAQANVRPRDTIGFDIEDFAGTGAYSPAERSQTTAWYERTWERGGKREARVGAARAEIDVTNGRNRLRLLELLSQVQTAWVDALAAEAAIPIAEQRVAATERMAAETGRRVGRALDPLFTSERAKAARAEARIELDQARAKARIARASLAAFWGGTPDYTLDAAAFRVTPEKAAVVDDGPDVAVVAAERDAADARVRLTQTADVGDPIGRVGVRHFGEGGDVAFVIGGSIPLGNRSANRGNISRAAAERQAAEAEIALTREQLKREADRLVAERAAFASEISRIEREVLPSAERAVKLVRDGFARGGTAFTFLEVTQAQDALIDTSYRRVDLLRRYQLAGVRLDRLTGRHLPLLTNSENK